ncbi:MAG: D-alanyl-alanine synthetase A [Candidatus Moranbacteria bacterium GW2011_GWE1_49_15]|nr:MAG: D-alanyl-alanine synthetase A [Candidatus Moranbacteria bacterium GW2011_GWE1_49_15]HBP00630.1 D-alanine--D-alanine ligase A [Candidatus Moranbacteria bacterium]
MGKKIKLGLVMGGKSGEHEVSLVSAWNIWNGLDKKKYDIKLVGIDKNGEWRFGKDNDFWINPGDIKKTKISPKSLKITAVNKNEKTYLIDLKDGKNVSQIDVFFLITHGTFGEDGCLQGFFEILGAAYVGPGVLGSAVGMDKDVMKRLLNEAGVPNAEGYTLKSAKINSADIEEIVADLGLPLFVKPANLGSSVGISKAHDKKELVAAIKIAFKYDGKVIVEKAIVGREIECAVMGNRKPIAAAPGEIKLKSEFYSYEAKYISDDAAMPVPVAELTENQKRRIQETAMYVYDTLECEGMARIDFFLTEKDELYVNEINTLPGFTNISMFPKMFEESGVGYSELLDRLIDFAIERKLRQDKLKRSF